MVYSYNKYYAAKRKENYMYYCAIISKIFYEKNKNLHFYEFSTISFLIFTNIN